MNKEIDSSENPSENEYITIDENNRVRSRVSWLDIFDTTTLSLIGVVFLILIVGVFGYYKIMTVPSYAKQSITSNPSIPSTAIITPISQFSISTCHITKNGNPLVGTITKVHNLLLGTFSGTIQQVTKQNSSSVAITILSYDLTQQQTLVISNKTPLTNQLTGQSLPFSMLSENLKVIASFRCQPEVDQSFTITGIAIVK